MKILTIITLMTVSVITANTTLAQKKVKEDSITVYGNCQECKERIEASLDLSGVKYANWNVKTKKLFIAYKPTKISEIEIHQAIADVGHDTEKIKAADSVYVNLSFCCLYRDGDPHGPHGEEPDSGHKKGHHPMPKEGHKHH